MGVAPTAQVLVVLHHAGALAAQDAADGARWLRARQEPDGSYRSHPTARAGDLGTTASVWAALHLCAPDDSADTIAAARAYVDGQGGTEAVVESVRARRPGGRLPGAGRAGRAIARCPARRCCRR